MRAPLIAVLILGATASLQAKEPIQVKWADLAPHVTGMTISAVLADGRKIEGRALSVEPDSMTVNIGKSSDKAQRRGDAVLPRTAFSTIRVQHEARRRQVLCSIVGAILGGAAGGLAGGYMGAAASHDLGAGAVGILIGGGAGTMTGIFLGRWAAGANWTTVQIVP